MNNLIRRFSLTALEEQEHRQARARVHPAHFYSSELWRTTAIFAVGLLIADAVSLDTFAGAPVRRLLWVLACSVVISAISLWRTRRSRSAADIISALRS